MWHLVAVFPNIPAWLIPNENPQKSSTVHHVGSALASSSYWGLARSNAEEMEDKDYLQMCTRKCVNTDSPWIRLISSYFFILSLIFDLTHTYLLSDFYILSKKLNISMNPLAFSDRYSWTFFHIPNLDKKQQWWDTCTYVQTDDKLGGSDLSPYLANQAMRMCFGIWGRSEDLCDFPPYLCFLSCLSVPLCLYA